MYLHLKPFLLEKQLSTFLEMEGLKIEIVRELEWKKGQKVEFRKKGKELIIKDWK